MLDIEGNFPFALWLSLPCLWWGLLPGWWNRAPGSVSVILICVEACGIGEHPLGEKPLRIAPLGNFPSGSVLCVTFMPCASSHVTLVGTTLGPTLAMGMMAHGPGASQMLFSPGHQHRSPGLRSQNCIHHGAGLAEVPWGQLRLRPGPAP